jgi:hypothetical protein
LNDTVDFLAIKFIVKTGTDRKSRSEAPAAFDDKLLIIIVVVRKEKDPHQHLLM